MLISSFISFFFFFKQKTAYEMRISDWSSDVCSSDLAVSILQTLEALALHWDDRVLYQSQRHAAYHDTLAELGNKALIYACQCSRQKIGRASCRERVCQYV